MRSLYYLMLILLGKYAFSPLAFSWRIMYLEWYSHSIYTFLCKKFLQIICVLLSFIFATAKFLHVTCCTRVDIKLSFFALLSAHFLIVTESHVSWCVSLWPNSLTKYQNVYWRWFISHPGANLVINQLVKLFQLGRVINTLNNWYLIGTLCCFSNLSAAYFNLFPLRLD